LFYTPKFAMVLYRSARLPHSYLDSRVSHSPVMAAHQDVPPDNDKGGFSIKEDASNSM
jgi:hypothetical protein